MPKNRGKREREEKLIVVGQIIGGVTKESLYTPGELQTPSYYYYYSLLLATSRT